MAKSRLEPNKIVRYAESSIPKNGISTRPTPRVQRTATQSAPKEASIPAEAAQVSAPAPVAAAPTPAAIPPPPPPAPPQTGSFSFDGATELKGVITSVGSRYIEKGLVHATLTPGWAQEDTGSFTLFSISNPSDSQDYRRHVSFRRTSGSDGYNDYLVVELSSGSQVERSVWKNPLSPNFYSGSTDEIFFQAFFTTGWFGGFQIDATSYGFDFLNMPTRESSFTNNSIKNDIIYKPLDTGDFFLTIGGQSSGSSSYFKGAISNFALTKNIGNYYSDTFPKSAEQDSNTDMVYRFEGNVSASKGGSDLVVVGTEAYVSGSL